MLKTAGGVGAASEGGGLLGATSGHECYAKSAIAAVAVVGMFAGNFKDLWDGIGSVVRKSLKGQIFSVVSSALFLQQ